MSRDKVDVALPRYLAQRLALIAHKSGVPLDAVVEAACEREWLEHQRRVLEETSREPKRPLVTACLADYMP